MRTEYPFYLANLPAQPSRWLDVVDKYDGSLATRVGLAGPDELNLAIDAVVQATEAMRRIPPFDRQAILNHCAQRFQERADELADALCVEAGKPIRDSRGEVQRLIDTFRIAAEEAVRIDGQLLNLETTARAGGYRGMVQRVPIGPCSFISPFNFPLNLAAHKIAPAIASGCPFVLKPASLAPVGALLIGEVLAETDLPPGAFSILPLSRQDAGPLTTDDRFQLLSFTGSPDVGWALKRHAGRKKVVLELGGNAACIVDRGPHDLDAVVHRLIVGAFYQSGQSCISVQRILIHREVYDALRERLIASASRLTLGNPRDEKTFIGPMISEAEAERVESWVEQAVQAGATLLCGGDRQGAMVPATLLEDVPRDLPVWNREVFGPVAALAPFDSFDEALQIANDSDYGLQCGVFTDNRHHMMRAWDELVVGGVIVGDVPSWRVDNMPYGGVKRSGFGREGIRCAIEDMTQPRLLVVRD